MSRGMPRRLGRAGLLWRRALGFRYEHRLRLWLWLLRLRRLLRRSCFRGRHGGGRDFGLLRCSGGKRGGRGRDRGRGRRRCRRRGRRRCGGRTALSAQHAGQRHDDEKNGPGHGGEQPRGSSLSGVRVGSRGLGRVRGFLMRRRRRRTGHRRRIRLLRHTRRDSLRGRQGGLDHGRGSCIRD